MTVRKQIARSASHLSAHGPVCLRFDTPIFAPKCLFGPFFAGDGARSSSEPFIFEPGISFCAFRDYSYIYKKPLCIYRDTLTNCYFDLDF